MAWARISAERSIKSKKEDCWSESSRTTAVYISYRNLSLDGPHLHAIYTWLQWYFDEMRGKGTAKHVCYNKVPLYQGSFPYILLLLRWRILFVSFQTQHITAINKQYSNESNNFMFRLWLHPFPWVSKAGVPLTPQKSLFNGILTPHQSHWWNCKTMNNKKKNNNNTHTFLTVGSALKGSLAP